MDFRSEVDRIRVQRSEAVNQILSDDRVLLNHNFQNSSGNYSDNNSNNSMNSTASNSGNNYDTGNYDNSNSNRNGNNNVMDNTSHHPSQEHQSNIAGVVTISHWNTLLSLLLVNSLGSLALIRVPWMIGKVGLLVSLPIILMCCATSLITISSVSQLSQSGSGNVNIYFQLHKYVGPYIGISIGVIFYFGQSLAVAMYALAAAEVLAWSPRKNMTTANNLHFEKQVYSVGICLSIAIFLTLRAYKFIRILSVTTSTVLFLTFLSVVIGIVLHGHHHNYENQNLVLPSEQYYNFSHVLSVYLTLTSVSYTQISSAVLPISSSYFYHSASIALLLITVISILIAVFISVYIKHDKLVAEDLIVVVVAWPWQRYAQVALIFGCYFAGLHRMMNASRLLSAIAYKGGWVKTGDDKTAAILFALRKMLSKRLVEDDRSVVISSVGPDIELGPNTTVVVTSPNTTTTTAITTATIATTTAAAAAAASTTTTTTTQSSTIQSTGSSTLNYNYIPSNSNQGNGVHRNEIIGENIAVADSLLPLNFNALLITWFTASVPCMAGNLNNLTIIISCCYLLTFMFVNAIAFLIKRNQSQPMDIYQKNNIRTFYSNSIYGKVYGYFRMNKAYLIPAFGTLCCLFLMFMISWWLSIILIVVLVLSVVYLNHTGRSIYLHSTNNTIWGEAIENLLDEVTKSSILTLDNSNYHNRQNITDWRPQYLVLLPQFIDDGSSCSCNSSNNNEDDTKMIAIANQNESIVRLACTMKRPIDLIQVTILIPEDLINSLNSAPRSRSSTTTSTVSPIISTAWSNTTNRIQSIVKGNGFVKTVLIPDISLGIIDSTIQLSGSIGGMCPNAVIMSWPIKWDSLSIESLEQQCDCYKSIINAKKALIVVKGDVLGYQKRPYFSSLTSSPTSLDNNINHLNHNGIVDSHNNHSYDNHNHNVLSNQTMSQTIDIWWVVHDGGLLLLLPTLLQLYSDTTWRQYKIRLFVVMTKLQDNPMKFRRRATHFLQKMNIEAEVEVMDLAIVAGEATWVYEQTISLSSRLHYLERMAGISTTMTLALQEKSLDYDEDDCDEENEEENEDDGNEDNDSNDDNYEGRRPGNRKKNRGRNKDSIAHRISNRVPHVADIFNLPRTRPIHNPINNSSDRLISESEDRINNNDNNNNNNNNNSSNNYKNSINYNSSHVNENRKGNKYTNHNHHNHMNTGTINESSYDFQDIYGQSNSQSTYQPRPGVLATLFIPDVSLAYAGTRSYAQQNPMYSSGSVVRNNNSNDGLNSRISASALRNSSIPLSADMLQTEENMELVIQEEAKKIANKYNADLKRIQVDYIS